MKKENKKAKKATSHSSSASHAKSTETKKPVEIKKMEVPSTAAATTEMMATSEMEKNDTGNHETTQEIKAEEKQLELSVTESLKQQEDEKKKLEEALKNAPADEQEKILKQQQKKEAKEMKKRSKEVILLNKRKRKGSVKVPNTEGYILEVRSLKKLFAFGDYVQEVLKGVDVKIKQGEFAVILGPSGSGKTTLLNIISGLDRPTFGDVIINNQNLACMSDSELTKFRRDNIGFVFQQYNLLPNLTVLENAEVGAHLQKDKAKRIDIKQLYEMMNMSHELEKFPHQISGGEQQRVSIARAVSKNPAILFADEPTGAIDEVMSKKILEFLIKINVEYKTTIIIVTHNPNIADIATQVIKIGNGYIKENIINKKPKKPSEIHWS